MKEIVWSDDFLIGQSDLDKQHQEIIGLVNLLTTNEIQADSERAEELFNDLFELVETHFLTEERICSKMDSIAFEQYTDHHNKFIEDLTIIAMDYKSFNGRISDQLAQAFHDLWTNHIVDEVNHLKKLFEKN